jgi:signal peptidase I
MSSSEEVRSQEPAPPKRPSPLRQLIQGAVFLLIFLLLFRVLGAEPYQVPTGSMWPTLAGHHRAIDCPRCGYRVVVGRHRTEKDNAPDDDRFYRAAVCPNCRYSELGLDHVPECPGDQLLVNKSVFDLRRPRRWETVVFYPPAEPGKAFVKRVVGLPGETVQLSGGDVYVNGELARKSLADFKALRIPVFDNNYQPPDPGFRERWESHPPRSESSLAGTRLHLDGEASPDQFQSVVYRHYRLGGGQFQAIQDEYTYNCGDPRTQNAVHDLMMECDVEVVRGEGWVRFGITDGLDRFLAEVPVRSGPPAQRDGQARLEQSQGGFAEEVPAARARVCARAPALYLRPGKTYHIEMAFVDRRLSFAVDGALPFGPVDLPAAGYRADVVRPVTLGARGVRAVVSNFRLDRDIYYTAEEGKNGVGEGVRLRAGEYFVLGDNSPNSHDSRYWPDRGAVQEKYLIGKPFLIHLPSRVIVGGGSGARRVRVVPDWSRIHWLR